MACKSLCLARIPLRMDEDEKITFLRKSFPKGREQFDHFIRDCFNFVETCDKYVHFCAKFLSVVVAVLSTIQTALIRGGQDDSANIFNYVITALTVGAVLLGCIYGVIIRGVYQSAYERSQSEFDVDSFWRIPNIAERIWHSDQTDPQREHRVESQVNENGFLKEPLMENVEDGQEAKDEHNDGWQRERGVSDVPVRHVEWEHTADTQHDSQA